LSTQVIAALVSGSVALIVGSTSALLSWLHFRREKRRWIVETKAAWGMELLKIRLESYPSAFRALAPYPVEPRRA
jgi:hypothetical protein